MVWVYLNSDVLYERYKIIKKLINSKYIIDVGNCKHLSYENNIEIYKTKYKYCSYDVSSWQIDDNFNIQKYSPTQGYHAWHCEKTNLGTARRHLVFMTYLNDVKKGGETEWFYQKLKVKPEKGLTIIFPSEWTFTHKGHTTINEDKYIITGWYHFLK
jgi:hypothetical protein